MENGYEVIGIARTNSIDHPNFSFVQLDLCDLEQVQRFSFDRFGSQVLLVNNAGAIGEINPVGKIEDKDIIKTMNVNTLSPQI